LVASMAIAASRVLTLWQFLAAIAAVGALGLWYFFRTQPLESRYGWPEIDADRRDRKRGHKMAKSRRQREDE
jgi:hypothetical protein